MLELINRALIHRDSLLFLLLLLWQGVWRTRYEEKKICNIAARDEAREEENERRRNYKPRTVDTAWLKNFDPKEYVVKPIPWNIKMGDRLSYCIICWKGASPGALTYACRLCPSIAHISCCVKVGQALESKTDDWWCSQCIEEIDIAERGEAEKLAAAVQQKNEFEKARLLQSNMNMYCERKRFRNFLGGLTFLQAVIRRQQSQGKFIRELMTGHRPLRVKAGWYENLKGKGGGDMKGNACCMMTMYKNTKNSDLDEGERHMYR